PNCSRGRVPSAEQRAPGRVLTMSRSTGERLATVAPGSDPGNGVRQLVTFGRVLREAGLEVGPGRISDSLRALEQITLARRDDVSWALRQTLSTRYDDLAIFDRAFAAWFDGDKDQGFHDPSAELDTPSLMGDAMEGPPADGDDEGDEVLVSFGWSPVE